jgi:hypothetical protein
MNSPLVSRYQQATHLTRTNLRDVENDCSRNTTDTQSGNETTSNQTTDSDSSNLNRNSNSEDQAGKHDSETTTNVLRNCTTKQSADEGTSGQDRGNERLARTGDQETTGILISLGNRMTEVLLDVVHAKDTRDVTRVIAVEDTCEVREGSAFESCTCIGDVDGTNRRSWQNHRSCMHAR